MKNGIFQALTTQFTQQSISKRAFNIDRDNYILSVTMTKPHKKIHSDQIMVLLFTKIILCKKSLL